MDDIDSRIQSALRDWGFSAEKIPESQTAGKQTPDFRVKDSDSEYLVEVKQRGDDSEELKRRHEALASGNVYESPAIRLTPGKRESEIIRHAQKQLKSDDSVNAFRIAWIVSIGHYQEAKHRKIEATLYGTTGIAEFAHGGVSMLPCYFFRNSEFFRNRSSLEAAIVTSESGGERLCLNPLSPRASEFRDTKLCRRFGRDICDPMAEVASKEAYLIDSDIDRSNESAVLEHLKKSTGRQGLMQIDMGYYSASILAPKK